MTDDKIKLVYSWIGPQGPIWNTELPHVLNFAAVAEGIPAIQSQWFWTDDARRFFASDQSNYDVYPVCSLEPTDNRPFVLPYLLSWRISFERYFTGNEGILEFSHVSPHVVDAIKNRNGYIFIDHSIEAFMSASHLDALHGYFGNTHNLPLYKIIYLTGCINAQELYDEYCTNRNIPDDKNNRLSIVTNATSFDSFVNHATYFALPKYNTEIVPNKLFLMWNRRIRQHRAELVMGLEQHNLVERSLISFPDQDVDRPGSGIGHHINPEHLAYCYNISPETVGRFTSRLPLILDGETNVQQMCGDVNNVSRPYYRKTLVSLVTETNFHDNAVSLTEKSFKPGKEMHPFIIAGVSGALRGMHELGFKTFSEFWDESYDDIKDHNERMNKIIETVAYIGTWDNDKILDFKRRVKPILEHNYDVIKNASTKHATTKITNIIRSNLV